MRWSIIRLIWFREMLDQLRDRRTLALIIGLPLVLYPLLSYLALQMAMTHSDQPILVGVVRGPLQTSNFPEPTASFPSCPAVIPLLAAIPAGQAPGLPLAATALTLPQDCSPGFELPLLVRGGRFSTEVLPPPGQGTLPPGQRPLRLVFLDPVEVAAGRQPPVEVLLAAPADFFARLERGEQPPLELRVRTQDTSAYQALAEVSRVLGRWKQSLREAVLRKQGLPPTLAEPFQILTPPPGQPGSLPPPLILMDLLLRVFPFVLVLWSLVGALYPAVDLCAGEKERGTMETLLISPATREEIVGGKFLTIWVFSLLTALVNLASLTLTCWWFRDRLGVVSYGLPALVCCAVLILPLGSLFGAVTLAIGAYARSSKEGQYYLLPLLLLVMPLTFLTLAPGVELNPFSSLIPVTGVALLMQELLLQRNLANVRWIYFLPVFATMVLYSWLALRWAIVQFQREEVLFREADRLDLRLWLRRLFRNREPLPSVAQTVFAFLVLLGLRWLSLGLGGALPVRASVVLLAFLAAPVLLMALLLTTRPRLTLGLRLPHPGYVLVGVLLLPLAELTYHGLHQFPRILELLRDRRSLLGEVLEEPAPGSARPLWGGFSTTVLFLVVLPAVAKELAFRGLILNGLRQRLGVVPASLLSAFLFALYHMNVFLLVPLFCLGVVLGVLAVRSGSILPGIVTHVGCNLLMLGGTLIPSLPTAGERVGILFPPILIALAVLAALLAVVLLWHLRPADSEPIGPI